MIPRPIAAAMIVAGLALGLVGCGDSDTGDGAGASSVGSVGSVASVTQPTTIPAAPSTSTVRTGGGTLNLREAYLAPEFSCPVTTAEVSAIVGTTMVENTEFSGPTQCGFFDRAKAVVAGVARDGGQLFNSLRAGDDAGGCPAQVYPHLPKALIGNCDNGPGGLQARVLLGDAPPRAGALVVVTFTAASDLHPSPARMEDMLRARLEQP